MSDKGSNDLPRSDRQDSSRDQEETRAIGRTRAMPAAGRGDNQQGDERTQVAQPIKGQEQIPAPPRAPNQQPGQPPRRPSRKGSARARRDSGLYLPLWSIALMLLAVCGFTVGVVALVLTLGNGGRETVNAQGTPLPPTQPQPVVIVSSPVPSQRPASFPESPATPTLPPEHDPNVNDGLMQAPESFSLQGPTLEPVEISPTPMNIESGVTVQVIDVGEQQLNVRDEPGIIGTTVRFRAEEGSRFQVLDGPRQVDNLSWWQIQDVNDTARTGWAASQYLQAVPGN